MNLRRAHSCAACAAKDQTIGLLADLVDWHRARESQSGAPVMAASTVFDRFKVEPANTLELVPHATWASDEEEDITAMMDAGALTGDAAEQALAAMQARRGPIELVK